MGENRLPVGLQLYGIRDRLEDFPGEFEPVMEKIKAMGYDGVELAGLYGLEPRFIREVLDRVGLVPLGAHVPFAEMCGRLLEVISDYREIGVKYLVMPYMAEEYRPANPDGFYSFMKTLGRIGETVHRAGMTLLYHNHDFEFVRLPDGENGYDRMFEMIPHEYLMAELDTCWCDVATGRTVEYIGKYDRRIPVVHLKDYIKKGEVRNMYKLIGLKTEEAEEGGTGYFGFRAVGFGQMIWEPVLEAACKAGAQWAVVEQDEHYETDSLECARRSREYLKILGW